MKSQLLYHQKRFTYLISLFVLLTFQFITFIPQAVFPNNPDSTCDETVVNGLADDCYTVTPLPGSVTIDGIITNDTEWVGVPIKGLLGQFEANIRFKREDNNLYFLISVDDNTYHDLDKIELYFDPLHNQESGSIVRFEIRRNGTDHLSVDWNPNKLSIKDASVCTNNCEIPDSFAGGWSAEVVISSTDLGTSDLPAILGFGVRILDFQNTINDPRTRWPFNLETSNPNTWANLKTRYPIEYMIVLDQSGSMLSQQKWENAKTAANFLANTMSILSDRTYFEDKLGVVLFSWNNSSNNDQSTNPKELDRIEGFPLGNYTDSVPSLNPPQDHFFTPIGEGLNLAFDSLEANDVKESERVILLLSDGKHNKPTNKVPLLTDHLDYDPCPDKPGWEICDDGTVTNVQVNTIAFGEDWGVDADLLTKIKNRFAGDFVSTYSITTDVEVLKQVFIQSLEELYQMNYASTTGNEFDVNAGEQKLIVILSWTNPAGDQSFYLQRKSSDTEPWQSWPDGQENCNVSATENTSVGYAVCVVENPQEGRWRAVQLNASGNPINPNSNSQFVLFDLNLRARFAIDQQVHGTGQDIILTADLREAGVPVTHDAINHPVTVTVDIKQPEEGFGTYLSLHTPDNCESQEPELPPVLDPKQLRLMDSGAAEVARRTSADFVAQSGNIDPNPARFEKFNILSDRCGKDGLNSLEDPGIELHDDGTNGDVTANDGIYTLRFNNTEYEGSYIFRFKASGISPSGSPFTRVKTIAEYVRVEVDPAETTVDSRVHQRSGNSIIREFYVTPRDRFGGYLGPGYPEQIQFNTTAGSFVGSVVDYNNGIYSQFLEYNANSDRPAVTPVVQNKPLKTIRAYKNFELVLPFAGIYTFDNNFGYDDGYSIGTRLGYRITNSLTIEAEGGITFMNLAFDDSGNIIQAMGNLRYDLNYLSIGRLVPYITGGAGYVLFRNFATDDESYAFQGGLGTTLNLSNSFGIRIDGRVFQIDEVMGIDKMKNTQITGGLVFRF